MINRMDVPYTFSEQFFSHFQDNKLTSNKSVWDRWKKGQTILNATGKVYGIDLYKRVFSMPRTLYTPNTLPTLVYGQTFHITT